MGIADRTENAAQDLGGRGKEAAGAVLNDDDLRSEGKVDQTKAKVKDTIDDAKDKVDDLKDKAKDKVDDVL